MTKRIQFNDEQLRYLAQLVEHDVVTPSLSPSYQLLNAVQNQVLDKIYSGIENDDEIEETV